VTTSEDPRELILATANPDKVAEIADILGQAGIRVLPRPEGVGEIEETGATLLDNARLKAVAIREATGRAAVADDTGLEVAALGGEPGVYSARYAGEGASYADNVAKLLTELERASSSDRTARFVTVAFVSFPNGAELWETGVVEGHIAAAPRGSNGFGYDPIFVPVPGDGRTFAELSPAEKHALSHRGRAFRALAKRLGGPWA
jgi:XTP/dITP diphosphohydrolase